MSATSILTLRKYQKDTADEIRALEMSGLIKRVIQAPTGSGKTLIISDLLTDPIPQFLVTHRCILCRQLDNTLNQYGISHGVFAAGYERNDSAPIQIIMRQTEWARKKTPLVIQPKRILIDELHANDGPTTLSLLDRYGAGASIIGFTATPAQVDHIVDDIIISATVPELVSQGFLVPHIIYGPLMPDMNALASIRRQVNGDYSAAELDRILPIRAIFGRVVDNWKLYGEDLPTILFATSVPNSIWMAQHLTAYGIPAAHIDCKQTWINGEFQETTEDSIDYVKSLMERGDIAVVCNRYLLREGVDWPFLKCAVLATSFGTRQSFVQAVGRIFRPCPGYDHAVVIDHGGNWLNHPALDSTESWDIHQRQTIIAAQYIDDLRNDRRQEPICCPKCTAIRMGGAECPACGYRHHTRSRWVFQANGTLKRVDGKAFKPRIIRPAPGDADQWMRRLQGWRKHCPKRTPNQLYAYLAKENGWRFFARDLPGMPVNDRSWYTPISELRASDLINGNNVLKGRK